jgi:pyruvate/2-oxoglutarate dehydrogenase complex dihydrolipoamide dehydrogenase (E3) component
LVTDESGWKKAGAEVIVGEASFEDRQTIRVKSPDGSSRQLKAKNICVAVGGVPAPARVQGAERLLLQVSGVEADTHAPALAAQCAGRRACYQL